MSKTKQPTKGEETRNRISRSAGELFEEHGYFGTGMNDILARAKAPKGSMYFHFPGGKEEVAVHAVQTITEDVGALLSDSLKQASSPVEAIHAIIGYFSQRMTDTDFKCGCPISTVGLELSGSGSPALHACADAYDNWVHILGTYFTAYLPAKEAADLANRIFYIVQGALLVSRVKSDVSHMTTAEQLCIDLVRPLTPH